MRIAFATVMAVGVWGATIFSAAANEPVSAPSEASEVLHPLAQTGIAQEAEEQPEIFEESAITANESPQPEVYLRLSTEVFARGEDNVEFQVPVRYSPTDQVYMEVSPFVRYQPENDNDTFDYGVRAAIEYRL